MSRRKKGEFTASLGDGRLGVAYSGRSVWLIDTLTGTKIVIYYHPYHRQWYIMLTDPQGNFVKRLSYISVCATAVFEYCARTHEGGNLYVDILFCMPIRDLELTAYWQPWEPILVAYRMRNRKPYYRWLRAVLPEVAKQIARRIQEAAEAAAGFVVHVFEMAYGLEPQYIGYAVTGYKYCSGVLYGIQCRLTPQACEPTRCKPICNVLRRLFPLECGEERERQCLAGEIYKPIPRHLYGRE
jgi:hypothetical protein